MGKISFTDRKVLITGASFGIGKALAQQFALRGAHLALGSLPQERQVLEAWARELSQTHHIRTWTFPIDLLSDDGPENLYAEVTQAVGDLYALVNNAGMVAYGRFWETDWDRQYDVYRLNFSVPMRLMYLFLPDMVRRGEGIIFNTSSVSALQPTPFQSVYGATKAGLQSLSQGIRAELKGTGVTICTLNPPYIDTRLLATVGYPKDLRFYTVCGKKTPDWLAEKALAAFEKRKMLYVPGFTPKLIHLALTRMSPRSLVDAVSRFFLQGWSSSGGKNA